MQTTFPDILWLFGAGASFGAGAIRPERPPLGNQLFQELARLFPGSWGSLPHVLGATFRADFEAGMAVLARDYSSAVPQLMRDMAIYFIQFRPVERRSLYNCLIHDVQAAGLIHRVGFSTLNYECVLEFAMLEEGLAIDYFGDAGPGSTRVWKLHGSSNMFSHGLEAGSGISYSAGVVFQGGIQAWLDPNKVISHCLAGTGLAPVMSLFMEGKPTSVSPSALQSVQKEWATAILAAKAIICVGVRPHPPDSHVWEPIANSVATLLFVGDETLFHNVLKSRRRSETVYLGSRFNVSYPELMATMMGI